METPKCDTWEMDSEVAAAVAAGLSDHGLSSLRTGNWSGFGYALEGLPVTSTYRLGRGMELYLALRYPVS